MLCERYRPLLTLVALTLAVGWLPLPAAAQTDTERALIVAGNPGTGDIFGFSVAMDGDTAVIGAPGANAGSGAVYVAQRSGTQWSVTQLAVSGLQESDRLGDSVAIDGDTIVAGASAFEAGRPGAAYVFVRSATGWTEQTRLAGSTTGGSDRFGAAVALRGDNLVVGAAGTPNSIGLGVAYAFRRQANGDWTPDTVLRGSDAADFDNFFGWSVALGDDTAAVGAIHTLVGGADRGAVHVFKRTATGWIEDGARVLASDGAAGDAFGWSVALSGDRLLVGSLVGDSPGVANTGAAYTFTRSATGWVQEQKLVSADGAAADSFGQAVALNGDLALITAAGDDDTGTESGSAYIFQHTQSGWQQKKKLLASESSFGNQLGWSAAISSDVALVGAIGKDVSTGGGSPVLDAGAVYVFSPAVQQPQSALDTLIAGLQGNPPTIHGVAIRFTPGVDMSGPSAAANRTLLAAFTRDLIAVQRRFQAGQTRTACGLLDLAQRAARPLFIGSVETAMVGDLAIANRELGCR